MKPVLVVRHAADDSMGTLDGVFRRGGVVFSYVDVFENAPPAFDPRQVSGLVVLGGHMNADESEKYPFLLSEVRWIQQAVEGKLPVLGICLGSQLLAKALGAPVRRNRVKEIGWYQVDLAPAARRDCLFQGLASPQTVFHWHGDTFDLPRDATLLARTETCENQSFRYGERAWGIQFHPEATNAIIEQWLTSPGVGDAPTESDSIDPDRIRQETPRKLPLLDALAEHLFSRFATLCRQRSEAG